MKSQSDLYSRYFSYIKPITKIPIVKNYGSTVFALLITSILIMFAIKPTIETILVLQKKLADSEKALQEVTQKANNLSLGKTNYDNLDPGIKERISTAVPDTLTLKSVIQALEQIASTHDASISALQIQPIIIDVKTENKVGTLSEISFTFNVDGGYANMITLLHDLKTSSRLISAESLSLSKATEGVSLIMSLSGKAYYLK